MSSSPLAFIGLGNPGKKHEGNRHNVGFMALDVLADEAGASAEQQKFSGLLRTATYQGQKLYFFKPQTFMNCSGVPTSELLRFFKIAVEDVMVVYDELDVALGKVKIKQGGGAGGHNGIKSLDSHIGKNYWRVRIGIDHPGRKEMVHSHVLSDFAKGEQDVVDDLAKELAKLLPKLTGKDMPGVLNALALKKMSEK